ncbi:MAG: hypothetical protein KA185_07250 [Vitreoscilla sp.]|nr:hypothetical protein [Vitreoscilla sp.]
MMGRLLVAVAALLMLGACSRAPNSELFPLDRGHHWNYEITTTFENNTEDHAKLQLSTLGSESIEGGRAFRRHSSDGVDYWLRADETGIYRVASKSELEAEPQPDKTPRYVLKQPLAVGTSWQASTTAYLLRRKSEFPPEIRHTHPAVPMNYSIDALAQAVSTRAGNFSGCVRVKGVATLKLFADPVVGWKDMPITTLEWYCPGVGLAKLERNEPANSTFLTGGTLKMDLVSWD